MRDDDRQSVKIGKELENEVGEFLVDIEDVVAFCSEVAQMDAKSSVKCSSKTPW